MAPVLVVDDSPALRHYLVALLSAEGVHDVIEAASAIEALRAIAGGPPSLVLLDLNLPTISGMELLAMLRARPDTATVPVVIVSTEAGGENQMRAMLLGANGFLAKPVDPGALREALRGRVLREG